MDERKGGKWQTGLTFASFVLILVQFAGHRPMVFFFVVGSIERVVIDNNLCQMTARCLLMGLFPHFNP